MKLEEWVLKCCIIQHGSPATNDNEEDGKKKKKSTRTSLIQEGVGWYSNQSSP